mmetsp:Transcript_23910/g.32668  ORF Transcript_23910/g.32668 Transcript_23910/m.32668 type:complete len:232 (-) Transcript_23910:466-1161(-)
MRRKRKSKRRRRPRTGGVRKKVKPPRWNSSRLRRCFVGYGSRWRTTLGIMTTQRRRTPRGIAGSRKEASNGAMSAARRLQKPGCGYASCLALSRMTRCKSPRLREPGRRFWVLPGVYSLPREPPSCEPLTRCPRKSTTPPIPHMGTNTLQEVRKRKALLLPPQASTSTKKNPPPPLTPINPLRSTNKKGKNKKRKAPKRTQTPTATPPWMRTRRFVPPCVCYPGGCMLPLP